MINCCSHPRRATTINQRSRWDRDLDTQKCENGCELYISVEDYDDKKDNVFPLSMEYSIHITTGEKPIEVEFDKGCVLDNHHVQLMMILLRIFLMI